MLDNIIRDAEEFIRSCYNELGKNEMEQKLRLEQIKKDLLSQGYYEHTTEELQFGAKIAWRNSNRCIGRLFWNNLDVIDRRNLRTEDEIYEALLEHIRKATNNGRISPTITIFPQESTFQKVRIWNHQLIRYAGYNTKQGVIGDSDSLAFTEVCIKLGWKPKFGQFDVLPLVIQINERSPRLYEIPAELLLEVPIKHPNFKWFDDLKLRWYSVPIISNMNLEVGGINYRASPFNGWYMGTEIGARNLADEYRYNVLPRIGSLMGLNTQSNSMLWKDRALLELNIAVLHSYKSARVSIVDHHTAAQQFNKFEEIESGLSRPVTGNWPWLIPPLSPATTHIFHKPYKNEIKKPNYFHQKPPYII